MGHSIPFPFFVLLWFCAANLGCFAYVLPPDLVNHEPLPETTTEVADEFQCESEGQYSKTDPLYCDRYVTCTYGHAHQAECPDGYAFQPFQGCKLLHQVDCGSRYQLQPSKGSGLCQRLNGIFSDHRGCSYYVRCTNGNPVTETCQGHSIFDEKKKICREPTLEEYSTCFLENQKPTHNDLPTSVNQPLITNYNQPPPVYQQRPTNYNEPAVNQQGPTNFNQPTGTAIITEHYQSETGTAGFVCPATSFFAFGDHARYEYPGNCHLFYICLRNGGIKLGGCQSPMAYDPRTQVCVPMQKIPGCLSKADF